MAASRLSTDDDRPERPTATVETIDEHSVARASPDVEEATQRARMRTPTDDPRTSRQSIDAGFPANEPTRTGAPTYGDVDAHNVTASTGSAFRERSHEGFAICENVVNTK